MVEIEIKRTEEKIKPKFDLEEECKKVPVLHAIVRNNEMIVTWSGEQCLILEIVDPDENIKVEKLIYPGGVEHVITNADIYPVTISDEFNI